MSFHFHFLLPFLRTILTATFIVSFSATTFASDWPTYRHDARRSAVSTDQLEFPLKVDWQYQPSHRPQPAFPDPLSHRTNVDFAYIRDHSQPVQLDFDHALHPVAANGRLFFGSSADDTVRCLSLSTGQEEWVYVTGGPVRFAPQVVGERLYVASDDGFVYCLTAATGQLIWKFRAAPASRQLVGNGRMISRWPLRSGVLVIDETVYVTAGMWPSEGVFVYALDAKTGKINWVNDTSGTINKATRNPGAYAISGVAPTGYLLAGDEALVVSTGRSIPASYSRIDGKLLSYVPSSYQNRRGGPARLIDPHGNVLFGYPRERLTGTTYSVQYAYRLPNLQQYGTVRADRMVVDDKTFLTVNDLIRCYQVNSRYLKAVVQWEFPCPSKNVHSLTLAANTLLMGIDNSIVARDRKTGEILWKQDNLNGYVKSIAVADSKVLVATDSGSIYCFATDGKNLTMLSRSTQSAKKIPQSLSSEFKKILADKRIQRGFALVVGKKNRDIATQLGINTQLQVILLLENATDVEQARYEFLQLSDKFQGRVSVQHYSSQQPLPFADFAFNLILPTSDFALKQSSEMQRVLRPVGGQLHIDDLTNDLKSKIVSELKQIGIPSADWQHSEKSLSYRRGKLPGALDWDSENLRDEHVKWPLELLWFGGPGSKRTGSGSRPPVAAGGRNLVVGKNHLIALDAYNGTELWSRTLPYLYRNLGRLKNTPGPIKDWLTQNINADDDKVYLNFGHIVYTLDANTGEQLAVHGDLPQASPFSLKDQPHFTLDHYQMPNVRGSSSTPAKAKQPAGSILFQDNKGKDLIVNLELDPAIDITDKLYWELFFDVRPLKQRMNLYERGIFQFLVKPESQQIEKGLGPNHPAVSITTKDDGRSLNISIPFDELKKLGGATLDDIAFAAALNHQPNDAQKTMASGRGYLRWEINANANAYAFNNGWPRIGLNSKPLSPPIQLPAISELPAHAVARGRVGGIGQKAGYVVNLKQERQNPLSLEFDPLQYNRGKGCGYVLSADTLHVLRSGTLAFYDIDDDSGMRYFGGVRPSCTISAVPSQGLVFAAEGSSGCSCNYNFKATLALASAKQRKHEDWAVYMAPLSPAAILQTGRFNLAAPGDRRDDDGGLWLQYPRAPTLPNRSMPVPVELFGLSMNPYRINADRVPIAETKRPWLFSSGFEGIEGIRLQLFMSDQEGAVVFPGAAPKIDAILEENTWERRYSVPAGTGSKMFLSHDKTALYLGYEVVPPIDRRGQRQPWTIKGKLPYSNRFELNEQADDTMVWEEDSLEFLVSDTSLKTILHFGIGVTGGRYDGNWSAEKNKEDEAYTAAWLGAVKVTDEKAAAEIALPWATLSAAGLDLENLVIRPAHQKTIKPPTTYYSWISAGSGAVRSA